MDAVSGADRVPVGQEQRVALVVRARAAHFFEHQLSRSEIPRCFYGGKCDIYKASISVHHQNKKSE